MNRVLIIEDNADLAAGIEYNLLREGLEVRVAEDGEIGLVAAREWQPGAIILDLMLPGIDGYEVLRTLRERGDRTPVLILSARAEESDRIRGFRLDADQYVTKPFGLLELIERVKSLLRRDAGVAQDEDVSFGDVVVNTQSRVVRRAGSEVQLTPREYALLLALIRRAGAVGTRVDLLREVWGHRGIVMTRTVDAHVKELRRKLEHDPAEPRHILTVWKIGYRFQP
ncbi:MAG TPA: response regulator transcription factor [Longimicrobiales bacterium]|nr:response regulator transcription factor [Longimicrobiales bacterium]